MKIFSAIFLMAFSIYAADFFGPIYTNGNNDIFPTTGAGKTNGLYMAAISREASNIEADYYLFLTNLAKRVGSLFNVSNPPNTKVVFTSTVDPGDIGTNFWYGEELYLYNGIYTQRVHNSVNTASNILPKISSLSNSVNASYLRITYYTYGNANPYTDVPGLRLGHTQSASEAMTNPPIILAGFGDSTQDVLLVVWKTPFLNMVLTGATYYSAFPASVIEYNGTNYQTIAYGLAGYGFDTPNMAEIIVVTNRCAQSFRGATLATYFNLAGCSATRAWWVYDRGRDFICFTNQWPGVYTNYDGANVVNYMQQ